MQYMVMLKKKGYRKNNNTGYYHDSLLAPDSDFDSLLASNCDDLGFCEKCGCGGVCHILRRRENKQGVYYDLLCPILFCDLVKPPFKVEDLG